jgi:hypothetical protein
MKIDITDHRKVSEIQKEFSELFPSLRLQIFGKPHVAKGATPHKEPVSPSYTIGQCRTIHTKGILTITPNMSVSDLEREFGDTYGLTIKVYFKAVDKWFETLNDMWPLRKHNEIAEANLLGKAEAI